MDKVYIYIFILFAGFMLGINAYKIHFIGMDYVQEVSSYDFYYKDSLILKTRFQSEPKDGKFSYYYENIVLVDNVSNLERVRSSELQYAKDFMEIRKEEFRKGILPVFRK